MAVRAVFLDIDGTLVDSNELHVKAWEEAFQSNGRPVSAADIRKQIGKGADMLIPALAPDIDADTQHAIDAAHAKVFESRYLREVKPFRRASDLVQMLHRRDIKAVLASSAKREELDHYVDLLGIERYLTASVTSEDVDRSKPAGDIFAAALAKVPAIQPNETVAIGDTTYDVESALKEGVASIALRTGPFSDAELEQAGARAIYDNVGAVLADLDAALRRVQ